jgi:NAD(P)-dependent dehydrogenase (short-subunit alcohol dehydrogenase family)
VRRCITDVQLADRCLELGLAGFGLKSHYTSTAERARVVSEAVPGVHAIGTITLNRAVGGLNPTAVEVAAREGARIVWFPTVSSENENHEILQADPSGNVPVWVRFESDHDDIRRIAVVTGGAGAIGGAIVDALSAGCQEVVTIDRVASDPVDLADERDVRRAADAALVRHGRVDVLVHAAAAFDRASIDELDAVTSRHMQAVNVESALWLCQAFVPGMRERGFGRIVFVVSDTIWAPPSPDLLAYVTSKAALVGLARALAMALGRDGATVNCVAPGLTRTRAAQEGVPAEVFAEVARRQAGASHTGSRGCCRRRRVRSLGRRGCPHRSDGVGGRRPGSTLSRLIS